MTQAPGMKAAHSQAKGPNYQGNKVKCCFTAWPSSQEPRKMFQQFYFPFGGGGWKLGGREPTVLETCSKLYSDNQPLSSKSAGKSQDYRSQNPLFLLNHLTHSTLPVIQSQGSIMRLPETRQGRGLDHTNLVTL